MSPLTGARTPPQARFVRERRHGSPLLPRFWEINSGGRWERGTAGEDPPPPRPLDRRPRPPPQPLALVPDAELAVPLPLGSSGAAFGRGRRGPGRRASAVLSSGGRAVAVPDPAER